MPKKKEKATKRISVRTTIIGPKKLTRFERARIVGARALQISMGAPVLLDLDESSRSPIEIAEIELQEGALPMSIRRSLPDGTSMNIPLKTLLEGERGGSALTKEDGESGERKTWTYAFIILLVVSFSLLILRILNSPFLVLDFELAVVYLPTTAAGIIVLYSIIKSRGT